MGFSLSAKGTTSLLPSPSFSNQEGLTDEVDVKYASDGTRYTYVTTKDRQKYQWQFSLAREKGAELEAFLFKYFADEITVIDHNDVKYIGKFTSNPFAFDTPGRGLISITQQLANERQTITLEFEGVEQV